MSSQEAQAGPKPEPMDLRDWFAGQALVGIVSQPTMPTDVMLIAQAAYHVADAMIAARAPQEKPHD